MIFAKNTLYIFATIFLLVNLQETFHKNLILSTNTWIGIGNFTQINIPQIRARLASEPRFQASLKNEIYIITYTPENYNVSLNQTNCTTKLIHMSDQFSLAIPMDGSWSEPVNLTFRRPSMFLIASTCFTNYGLESGGHFTEFEISGCDYTPIEQPIPKKTELLKAKIDSMSHNVGTKSYSIISLLILLSSILLTHILYNKFTNREFLFQFVMLIFAVLLRIFVHILLMIESYQSSRFLYSAALFTDAFCQFTFTAHCIITVLGYPITPLIPSLINGIITAILYFILSVVSTPYAIIGLRLILAVLLTVCYIYKMNDEPTKIKTATYILGTIYLVGMIILGISLIMCSEIVSILLNRIEFLLKSDICPNTSFLIIMLDFLFQSTIVSLTLFISAYITTK